MKDLEPMRLFFVVIFLVGLMEPTSAIGGNPDNDSLQTDYRRLPAQVGENCTVGGTPLTEEDVALIVRGRRVPLHRLAVQEFLKNQEKYFAKLQPKGALFQEDLTGSERSALGRITWGWFLFGMYVLVALLFGGLSGYVAIMKGLSPVPNFFIGFVFSVPGYLYVLTRPRVKPQGEVPEGLVKVPTTSAPVPCPACGSMNHPSASKCAGCRTDLHPAVKSEVSKVLHH
ncbi:MAG: zinc finger Ran-binding domain-containing protein [Ignavibacteria bacterium]|nr:zinc finger Ran-binding domain-containing protein [Ignavibacteria bacterium]